MKNKKGFEFSFAWMFAVLVGAVILFLAVYFAVKFVSTGTSQVNTITAKQLSIIFEPMETGLLAGEKPAPVSLKEETRIYDNCYDSGSFGNQKISLATKSLSGNWEKSVPITINNKYIFSDDIEQGKEVYFFSKPLDMPWKVSELIFLTTGKYCFINAPDNIKDEVLLDLQLENIQLDNCSDEVKVCFGLGNCDIKVEGACLMNCENEYDYGVVMKEGKILTYTGSLIYGAIFSSPDVYECNVKRLMKRLRQEALLLKDESDFLSTKCGTSSASLISLANAAASLDNTRDLISIKNMADELNEENDAAECSLW